MAGASTVTGLVPLAGGDLLVASQDPWLGRLAPDGTPRWRHGPPAPDFRGDTRPCGDPVREAFGTVTSRL
jgi:hypothetical protein